MKLKRYVFVVLSLFLCSAHADDQGEIHVTLLHFNDVYEIIPTGDGKEGGLARVATLRKQLLSINPNTITLLGGDFLSPSAMGMAPVDGEPLQGKHMVDVLNGLGLDYATFGNHEFDLKERPFLQRVGEAKFTWVSSNVTNAQGALFAGQKTNVVLPIRDANSGKVFRIGILGLTLNSNQPSYVKISEPYAAAEKQLAILDSQSDFVVALTHQAIGDDEALLQRFPQIDLLLGGHEHANYQRWRGANWAPLLKADANVRSVYVVDIYANPSSKKTRIETRLVQVNDTIAENAELRDRINDWKSRAFAAFQQQGLKPAEVVFQARQNYDGVSSHVRTGQTNLTRLIAESMLQAYAGEADLSVYNSGSIRIDDVLPVGDITVYDVIRVLPFGGDVRLVKMKGALLLRVLQQGELNVGSGGYLQSANTAKSSASVWQIAGQPIVADRTYTVAMTDFLLSGREVNLDFLTLQNPEITVADSGQGRDLRKLLIEQWKLHPPSAAEK
ncbi:MAG: bifunctional metallophosphatase/5'-nucleotidase [Gammaproteobacteria bacterium]|nr:bifunctional metallophosphatase/5'-nucleotidase [Gammaproteobacteria bacterium]